MTAMMEDVIRRGTGTRANIGRPAAGKTGTTSDYHDAWFVGYTPDLVAGVWIGNDSVSDLHGMAGGRTPAVIWQAFMLKAHAGLPVRHFESSPSYAASLDKEDPAEDADKESDDKKTTVEKGSESGKHSKGSDTGKKSTDRQSSSNSRSASSSGAEAPEPGTGVEKGKN